MMSQPEDWKVLLSPCISSHRASLLASCTFQPRPLRTFIFFQPCSRQEKSAGSMAMQSSSEPLTKSPLTSQPTWQARGRFVLNKTLVLDSSAATSLKHPTLLRLLSKGAHTCEPKSLGKTTAMSQTMMLCLGSWQHISAAPRIMQPGASNPAHA